MSVAPWLEDVLPRLPGWFVEEWVDWLSDWPTPDVSLAVENPYDEDCYCEFCGNGSWKFHAPWCAWAVLAGVDRISP